MGGSQLKNLKAALKANGFTGQTNAKKTKKNKAKMDRNYDREERMNTLSQIREQFNVFDIKAAKNKRADALSAKQDKVIVGKPGISKEIGEYNRKQAYEANKATQNKKGGIIDRRFGERNKHLTEEERMLERFTRERQIQSKLNKKNLYNLEDEEYDDELDMFGAKIASLGDSLNDEKLLEDEYESSGNKRSQNFASDTLGDNLEPKRKKTKAEVMKEVIAKSKFYKNQRQKAQEKLEEQIDELDNDFQDVLTELGEVQPGSIEVKSTEISDKEYDIKVRELQLEKRAVPSDRTKTDDEIREEREAKMKELEKKRQDRMSGLLEDENEEEKGVEDLDDDFWASGNEYEESIADSDDDVNVEEEPLNERNISGGDIIIKETETIICPESHPELMEVLHKKSLVDHPKIIKKIIKLYQPKLSQGNKEKLGKFTGVLLRHIIFLSNQEYKAEIKIFSSVQNSLIMILKAMAEKYNLELSQTCRAIIKDIQKRFKTGNFSSIHQGDLVFLMLVGMIYSTSDLYHLVITPCQIVISEMLEQVRYDTLCKLAFGTVLVRLTLQYQRLSKRYIPEVTYFMEKSLSTLISCSSDDSRLFRNTLDAYELGINKHFSVPKACDSKVQLHQIFTPNSIADQNDFKMKILINLLTSLDNIIGLIWNNLPAFCELVSLVEPILDIYETRQKHITQIKSVKTKLTKYLSFIEHVPLTLQKHRPVSIPSNTPKFEENFNPDKKSYDPDPIRNEVNKMKAQLKKERKFTMKEIRKDTRYEARQQNDEQRTRNVEYHSKMARIINTINTEEGAEKNKYEQEKRLRAGKK